MGGSSYLLQRFRLGRQRVMRRFPKPCRICGQLSLNAMCEPHQAQANLIHEERRRIRKKETGQYGGSYATRARAVREAAIACHLCGEGKKINDPFEADHINPSEPGDRAILLPAHRSCNQRRGNRPLPQ